MLVICRASAGPLDKPNAGGFNRRGPNGWVEFWQTSVRDVCYRRLKVPYLSAHNEAGAEHGK
jgi:hypothetical protein